MDQQPGPKTFNSVSEAMDALSKAYKGKDWFYEVGQDQFGRVVVYVKYMNHETLYDIPDYAAGVQVLVHFAASKTSTANQFMSKPNGIVPAPVTSSEPVDEMDEVVGNVEEEKSLRHLQNELDKLEKICGSFTLNDIFYEVHDKKNAVTNMSARYPEVRDRLEKLFKMYGFDVIYEELDG